MVSQKQAVSDIDAGSEELGIHPSLNPLDMSPK